MVLETLRAHLLSERDRMAEALFMSDEVMTQRTVNSQELRRENGQVVENNLFEATYKDDLNNYEQSVACYLDGEKALRWWHRNVAQRQYALQGWRTRFIQISSLQWIRQTKKNVS